MTTSKTSLRQQARHRDDNKQGIATTTSKNKDNQNIQTVNYQYIEQLLDRYWKCETTLEEEQILRSFFSQVDVPASLKPYATLFAYEATQQHETTLGSDFEQRIMDAIESETDKQQAADIKHIQPLKFTWSHRLAPLLKAAAVVAVVVTAGNISERTLQTNSVGIADDDMTANDTYIMKEDISAKIHIIDQNKSEAMACTDSIQSQNGAGTSSPTPLDD